MRSVHIPAAGTRSHRSCHRTVKLISQRNTWGHQARGPEACGRDALVDLLVDGAQGGAELGWGLGLADGEQQGQDAVVDFGVEDREGEAVGGEVVGIGMRAADKIVITGPMAILRSFGPAGRRV